MTVTNAIITGASSGVGLAVARKIHARGGSVALLTRRGDLLTEIVDGLEDRAYAFPVDVSDPVAVSAAVRAAFAALGDVTLVVNSAGVVEIAELSDITDDVWARTLGVNLSGTFYVAREAAPRMSTGSIVNLGSELSTVGMGLFVHYCASKAGVIGLTKALAAELAPRGIRVNAVCPGPIDTPMLRTEFEWFGDPEATIAGAIDRIPLKRFASADEVADAVLYLHAAGYATGSCLALDGGTTAV